MTQTLIIAMPTHDSRAVIQSLLELLQVSQDLARPVWVVTSEVSNIPRARNLVLDRIRDRVPATDHPWVLWVDSDIVIPLDSHRVIAGALRWAEEHNRAITANYLMGSGVSVLMKSRDPTKAHHYTARELDALPPYAEVGMSGFGFLYLRQPLDYTFHADRVGEDVHFWWDYPETRLFYARQIPLGHKKFVLLSSGPQTDPGLNHTNQQAKQPVRDLQPRMNRQTRRHPR
ncbi:MAG: hypothetical protein OWR62_15890 [Sulfobacillus thermotolerans]|nr:hypothetical protein [Sulfobacillus thermotolerans]